MSKNPIKYITLEKIMKRHYKNSKTINYDFGSVKGWRRNKTLKGTRICCSILIEDSSSFYEYDITLQKHQTNTNDIHLAINMKGSKIYDEDIISLDRLFKLLANKGKLLKRIADDKVLVKDI